MIRAQRVLGVHPYWKQFDAHLRHALRYGFDHRLGGFYNRGDGDHEATQLDKVWWVQAEGIAALAEAQQRRSDANYSRALTLTLDFVDKYFADPKDGVWADTVTADGQPKVPAKAHNWKANYHDVRALVKYIETFAPGAFNK